MNRRVVPSIETGPQKVRRNDFIVVTLFGHRTPKGNTGPELVPGCIRFYTVSPTVILLGLHNRENRFTSGRIPTRYTRRLLLD